MRLANWRVSAACACFVFASRTTPEVILSIRFTQCSVSPSSAAIVIRSVSCRSPITDRPCGLSTARTASSSQSTIRSRMSFHPATGRGCSNDVRRVDLGPHTGVFGERMRGITTDVRR